MRITYIGGEIIHGYWRLKAQWVRERESSHEVGLGSKRQQWFCFFYVVWLSERNCASREHGAFACDNLPSYR